MSRLLFLLGVCLILLAAPSSSQAQRQMELVVQDDAQLLHRPHNLDWSMKQMQRMGVDRIRVTAGWGTLTRQPESEQAPVFDAANPDAYEQERWTNLDRLVRAADAHGLQVMIDIAFWAPQWAGDADTSRPDRPRINIDLEAYRRFSLAVVRRYNGSYVPPAERASATKAQQSPSEPVDPLQLLKGSEPAGEEQEPAPAPAVPLPKVKIFTVWNEPNHHGFILPQWKRRDGHWQPASPHIYRKMVEAVYPALKAERPDSTVLVGGLASIGGPPAKQRGVPPLAFIRSLACVDRKLRPLRDPECQRFRAVEGDGWSYHPYSLHWLPSQRRATGNPDDAPIGDLSRVIGLINKLVAQGRLSPGLRDFYLTEYGYETKGPDSNAWVSQQQQPRLLAEAMAMAWFEPQVKMFPQFLLRDMPCVKTAVLPCGDWQSGLFTEAGHPKPSAQQFGRALVSLPKHSQRVWVRLAPEWRSRPLQVQYRNRQGKWRNWKQGAISPDQVTAQGFFSRRWDKRLRPRGFRVVG